MLPFRLCKSVGETCGLPRANTVRPYGVIWIFRPNKPTDKSKFEHISPSGCEEINLACKNIELACRGFPTQNLKYKSHHRDIQK